MKRIFSSIVAASLALSTFAGGLLTNTNQSAAFVRNPMRYASLETDAIYFNPAGTAFFKEGWAFSANWQMIWQDRDVTSLLDKKTYKGEVYVPCMPTLMAAYKTGDWTFSGFFGIPGGGGKCEFNNGLPMLNNMVNGMFAQGLQGMGLNGVGGYTTESAFQSTQYMFSLQLGAAYKINENLSVYGGVRANYTNASYEGTITTSFKDGITIGGNPIAATPAAPYEQAILAAAPKLAVDMTQSGLAFAPIVGIDYKVGNFNFAAKYEFRAVTTVENDTEGAPAQLPTFADGVTFRSDAPALLSLAGSWQVCPRLQVMAGWNYYFDKDAKVESLLGGDNNKNLDDNTYELLAGVEFKLTDKWLLSAGIQYSNFGITDKYTSDLSFINDSFMTGVGAKYSINEQWDINFGACYANYAHDVNRRMGSDYMRKTYNVAVGVDFKF
ncbi:MAG: TonB-dependent receptor [Bacteroidales bacterium]|nr:TonB-dependent receptor [Bacteroidales bacterium]